MIESRPKRATPPKKARSRKGATKATSRVSGSSRDAYVVCELTCEDPEAILEFADDMGKLAADLWLQGKLR
jgi:hypothetical protein